MTTDPLGAPADDPLADPRDREVVALLRQAAPAVPDGLDLGALLQRSRRSERRHQLAAVGGGAAAAAAAVVLAVTLTTGHRPPAAVPAGPTTSATSTSTQAPTPAGTDSAVSAAVGPDWVLGLEDHEGNLELRPGSPTAATVPAGWTVSSQVLIYQPSDIPLDQLCAPLAEKGYTFDGCTPEVGPDGVSLLRRAQSGGGSGGTSSQVRYLHDIGAGRLRVVDLVLHHDGPVPPAELARADAWVAAHEDAVRRVAALGAP